MESGFYFDIKKAAIWQAVTWGEWPTFKYVKVINRTLLALSASLLFLFLFGLFNDYFDIQTLARFLGFSIILMIASIFYWWKEFFFKFKLKNPSIKVSIKEVVDNPQSYNLAEFLSYEAARAIFHANSDSTRVFFNLLNQNEELNFVFGRALVNSNEIQKSLLQSQQQTDDFQDIILDSLKTAESRSHNKIGVGDMMIALARSNLVFKQILVGGNLKVEDIENLAWWLESLKQNINEGKKFWEWKNLIKAGSMAKDWSSGYTISLDRFSIDISDSVKKRGYPDIIGHQKEIEAMERILAGNENNNVLIVGEPGSGRKSMVDALAIRSVLGESLPDINHKRVVLLDIASLVAQSENQEMAGGMLEAVFAEVAAAGNIILVIDEFHNFVSAQNRAGIIDVSGVLTKYLGMPQFKMVAITSFEGLHKNIEENPSVLSLFGKVEVSEISERETLQLLESLSLSLERKYGKFVSYQALSSIISFAGKYFQDSPFPEKALNLLDEAMVWLSQGKEKILLPKNVAQIVAEKTQIPVGEMEKKEKEILLDLENMIHQRIINQEEAVKEVSAALRRARAAVQTRKGPMGSFLFLGPTGVGKTETAKALAEIYFGSERKMVRLDMSEFQNLSDISRLLGSSGQEGLLTTRVRENPFSLILLDEIEKAHLNILNLFLQVLDEGHITDGLGRKVDFKSSIIIATSNAGYQVILEAIKQNINWKDVKGKILDYLFANAIFRPEFINRFDSMVIFQPLSKDHLLKIAELILQKLKKNLKEKEIDFIITESLKEKIVELGYDPIFGAREMKRVIQDKVENIIASFLLSEKITRGSRVEINPDDFTLQNIV